MKWVSGIQCDSSGTTRRVSGQTRNTHSHVCRVAAVSVAHWERLQQEKEELERRCQAELLGLRARQRTELGELEERLKARHAAETEGLQARRRAELEELRVKQRQQVCV